MTAALLLPACGTLSYYAQSVSGHLGLMASREPLNELLADPATDVELKQRLDLAREIREYASRELALPDNGSYRSYVDTGRPYLIWSLFATPEFSLKPKNWCFPFAGCVSYRGYFNEADAQVYAKRLRAEGLEVFVGGVAAYSTLGWFNDPLLNTMLHYDDARLAGLIFHELAHQAVYVPGDTPFNEAFAVAVAESGVKRWLRQQQNADLSREYEALHQRELDFLALVQRTRRELRRLYRSGREPDDMRVAKRRIIEAMRADYRALRRDWGGYTGYDRWFNEPIDNAKLAAVGVYRDLVPAFTRLLADCGGDYERFYARVAELGELDHAERRAQLRRSDLCARRSP